MKPTRRLFLAVPLTSLLPRADALPARKRRADSYFGLHFDLHPNEQDRELGADLTPEHAAYLLDQAKPDYIQYDCKGHPGWLGYRSQISDSAPGIVNDGLAIWREATANRGIGLYIHFSGVWDSLAVKQHPEWARVDEKGARDTKRTSTFGPYAGLRMLPQLQEVVKRYNLDGVWVDGECWATYPDYCETAVRQFGGKAPLSSKDPRWLEWLEFNRQRFRQYVRHYVETLHRTCPGLQITSNWLYSTHVPEKPELPVDFLSGDYLGNAPVSSARLEARYLAQSDRPWDLMAWGFQSASSNKVGHVYKPAVQLMQEASVVLAQGGGFQIYYQPTRRGRFEERHIAVMRRVGEFCRARQKCAHRTQAVPQVAVLYSGRTLYRTGNRLFGGWGARNHPAQGLVELLLACHYSVEILPDWKLAGHEAYPLLVVPDWADVGPVALAAIRARKGATLICGAENAGGAAAEQPAWLAAPEAMANAAGLWAEIDTAGARVLAERYPTYDSKQPGKPAAIQRGQTVTVPGPLGKIYAATNASTLRDWLRPMVRGLFAGDFSLNGAPPTIEAALRRRAGTLILHLIDSTGMQVAGDHATLDYVAPVAPFTVAWKVPRRPRSVVWEPGGRPLPSRWHDGVLTIETPPLEIMGSIVLTEAV